MKNCCIFKKTFINKMQLMNILKNLSVEGERKKNKGYKYLSEWVFYTFHLFT